MDKNITFMRVCVRVRDMSKFIIFQIKLLKNSKITKKIRQYNILLDYNQITFMYANKKNNNHVQHILTIK